MTEVPPSPAAGAPGPNPGEQKNNLGVWALVLGILSILCCGLIAGIPAIILGKKSKDAGEQGLATNGNVGHIGFVLGIIGTALWLLLGILNLIGVAAVDWNSYTS